MSNLIISVSGGRTSAFLARLIQLSPMFADRRKVFIFANTGKEREETLKFLSECDLRWQLNTVWVEAVVSPTKGEGTKHRVVSYETAVRNTDPHSKDHPFVAVVEKYGLPTNAFPHCTRELKLRPIASYLKSIGVTDCETAIGIRYDEKHRVRNDPKVIYPLVDLKITEQVIRTFWDRQGFDLGLKDYEGNCDLCFKKSLRKRLTILREHPEYAPSWSSFEGIRQNPKGRMVDLAFDRNGFKIPLLLEMSQDPSLEIAVDKHEARLGASPELFAIASEADWDFEKPCHCQST